MKLTRREFAGYSAGLPLLGAVALPRDPDVVVVGAGAAGLAAAQVLTNAGKSVRIVEAAARIGGRCFTDTAAFGWPFERGAAWLRNGNQNPLYGFARLFGFQTSRAPERETLYAGGRVVSPDANAAFERAYDALSLALGEAAESEADCAASLVVLPEPDATTRAWLGAVAAQIGPLDMAVDFETLSVKDWFMREDAEPRQGVREGVGTLVSRLADGLPVSVNTRVSAIRSAPGGRVAVETSRGTLMSQAVIVTASIGALAGGRISFEPAIGPDLQRGLDGMQMGHLTKIALSFAAGSPSLRFAANSVLVPQLADQRGAAFFARPFGAPLVICETGGSLALELEQQGAKEQLDFARGQLKSLLGSKADQGFRAGAATDWGHNPLFLGALASAKPGALQARDLLSTPIQERIFLAGEALAGKAAQTVHGAYASGQVTARRVISVLNRSRLRAH